VNALATRPCPPQEKNSSFKESLVDKESTGVPCVNYDFHDMLNELYVLSFGHEGRQTSFYSARKGVDIKAYGARIGGSVLDNAVESIVLKRRQESFSAKGRFVGLVNCEMKMNPGSPVEQVRIDQILA
jgi:hypothetical protein